MFKTSQSECQQIVLSGLVLMSKPCPFMSVGVKECPQVLACHKNMLMCPNNAIHETGDYNFLIHLAPRLVKLRITSLRTPVLGPAYPWKYRFSYYIMKVWSLSFCPMPLVQHYYMNSSPNALSFLFLHVGVSQRMACKINNMWMCPRQHHIAQKELLISGITLLPAWRC